MNKPKIKKVVGKIPQMFQTLQIGSKKMKIIDFKKVSGLKYTLNLIITARGYGKTFNMKEFMLDEYLNHGKMSGWILNTETIWRDSNSYIEFMDDNVRTYPERWKDIRIAKQGLYHRKDENSEEVLWLRFLSLSQAEKYKTNRQLLHYLCWDELNVSLRTIRKQMRFLYNSLVLTYSDSKAGKSPQQFWFCNQKSLALPIFESLEIDFATIKNEFTFFTLKGSKCYSLFVPKGNIKMINARAPSKSRDAINSYYEAYYQISRLLETSGAAFENVNDVDNVWGVKRLKNKDLLHWKSTYQFLKVEDSFYELFTNERMWYYKTVKQPQEGAEIYTTKKSYLESGVQLHEELRFQLIEKMRKKELLFENINVKLDILKSF